MLFSSSATLGAGQPFARARMSNRSSMSNSNYRTSEAFRGYLVVQFALYVRGVKRVRARLQEHFDRLDEELLRGEAP